MLVRAFERLLFASRWLVAPFYVGLVLSLGFLGVTFFRELAEVALHVVDMKEEQALLAVLTLVDLLLVANLLVMVILAGYENFVSRIDVAPEDRPKWLETLDAGGLKQKLLGSIIAISGIQLLKLFFALDRTPDRDLAWAAGIHVVFVVSGLLVAWMERLGHREH